jgi:2,3-bisphosphoglycerate-independent phosphoglycerate mutase
MIGKTKMNMKYAIIIPDGCADEPQESLGGKTPLAAADIPTMDAIAAAGVVGRASNVPASLPAGSAVANMSLLGYDPKENFTGRAPIEAAAQGIELSDQDWAVRCNLVTIEDQTMRDFTAGHISTDEAAALLAAANEHFADEHLEFLPGVSYRNLLIYRNADGSAPFTMDVQATPPHDLIGRSVVDDYPRGPGSGLLTDLMSETMALFADHPVNAARRAAGKLPATNVWLWGLGQRPKLEPFAQRFGVSGKMITAVDLLRGLAGLIGWENVNVPGATGYHDTDYAAKGRFAVEALADADVVCVHVEAPDEASHEGDTAAKIRAIEQIDRHIVAPLWEALKSAGEYRILVSPDHPTPLRTRTHSHGFVPLAVAGAGIEPDRAATYDDATAAASDLVFEEGWKVMPFFLQ